ncbi:MAG: flagellar regulator YcgR PilZN domain-containing protein [Pseudomonadota bacterium]
MLASPAPLEAVQDSDLCVRAGGEIAALLDQLRDAGVALTLHSPHGPIVMTQLWTVDEASDTISLRVDPEHPSLQALIESDEATAVAYLDSVKLQFDLQNLMLVRGTDDSVLHCTFPRELFRFQRRNSFRVQPLGRTLPKAAMRHPMIAEMQLELRVLDMSLSGCALFLPNDVPPLAPGIRLNEVRFLFDTSTRFVADLHLHHVTALSSQNQGVRLGCEVVSLNAEAQRALQRYIDQNQKQRRLMGA